MARNVYFELTAAFNRSGRIAILTSGQAVVHYRLAMMSKDGDWILRESEEACRHVLEVLSRRGARYRPGAPLDIRWLAGGWSSHFEFADEQGRRVRCDFFTRPPRLSPQALRGLFAADAPGEERAVLDVEGLIWMKQTQRAKDYPIIGELARLLPPAEELALTTDPDRILALAPTHGEGNERPSVLAARRGDGRLAVVLALAAEVDRLQQRDRQRASRYEKAAARYLQAFRRLAREQLLLPEAHDHVCALARELLPRSVEKETPDAPAQ